MIGRLQGKLIQKQPPRLLIDVQGVGYEVEAPMTTIYKLPELNEEVTLFKHLVVRDDAHLLFAFAEERERLLFRTLIKVNGVGPATLMTDVTALTITGYDDGGPLVGDPDTVVGSCPCGTIRRIAVDVTAERGGITESLRFKVFIRSTMSGAPEGS